MFLIRDPKRLVLKAGLYVGLLPAPSHGQCSEPIHSIRLSVMALLRRAGRPGTTSSSLSESAFMAGPRNAPEEEEEEEEALGRRPLPLEVPRELLQSIS
jgi:hypothetical protein